MSDNEAFLTIASASRDFLSKLEKETNVEAFAAEMALECIEGAWREFEGRDLAHFAGDDAEIAMVASSLKALFYAGLARQAAILAKHEASSAQETFDTFAEYRLARGHLDFAKALEASDGRTISE